MSQMNRIEPIHEVILQPGDFHFGDADTKIRTLLGSCVSITMWHPEKRIGGMCHYMLPARSARQGVLDGRYADEAMELFMREIRAAGTHPSEYRVKAFGGGNMFPGIKKKHLQCGFHATLEEMCLCRDVACRNAGTVYELASRHGFEIEARDLGGAGHRNVIFDIGSGHVWVRQTPHVGEKGRMGDAIKALAACPAAGSLNRIREHHHA